MSSNFSIDSILSSVVKPVPRYEAPPPPQLFQPEPPAKTVQLSLSSILFILIAASKNQMIRVTDIYKLMMSTFEHITKKSNWKNSVRQMLSTNGNFNRVRRPFHEGGKGDFWTLSERAENSYVDPTTGHLCSSPTPRYSAHDWNYELNNYYQFMIYEMQTKAYQAKQQEIAQNKFIKKLQQQEQQQAVSNHNI